MRHKTKLAVTSIIQSKASNECHILVLWEVLTEKDNIVFDLAYNVVLFNAIISIGQQTEIGQNTV